MVVALSLLLFIEDLFSLFDFFSPLLPLFFFIDDLVFVDPLFGVSNFEYYFFLMFKKIKIKLNHIVITFKVIKSTTHYTTNDSFNKNQIIKFDF